jgi:hypothetical protein
LSFAMLLLSVECWWWCLVFDSCCCLAVIGMSLGCVGICRIYTQIFVFCLTSAWLPFWKRLSLGFPVFSQLLWNL